MEQKNELWAVNYPEAVNRTCEAIRKEYKAIIDLFNTKIVDACTKLKHEVTYRTDNEKTFNDLHYFYSVLGYKIETDEQPKYKDGVEYTVYKIKLMW